MNKATCVNLDDHKPLVALIGCTASGKTSLAVALANALNGEIISADSRQVYRRMDIGTGKDLDDYTLPSGKTIPFHLIDIEEPGKTFDLFQWLEVFSVAYEQIVLHGKRPVLVGGTGLYLESALKQRSLTPVTPNWSLRSELEQLSLSDLLDILRRYKLPISVDSSSHRRALRAIEIAHYYASHTDKIEELNIQMEQDSKMLPHILLFIDIPKELRWKRIENRLNARLNSGMIAEVEALLSEGIPADKLISYGLEYRFITLYLEKKMSYNQMYEQLFIAIRQFSKRQMTWIRGMERRGFTLHPIDGTKILNEQLNEALKYCDKYLA